MSGQLAFLSGESVGRWYFTPTMTLASNLKRIRKDRGLSQAALAEKAGVMQQLVSQIENGKNTSTKKLPDFARALNCSVEDLDPSYSDGGPDGSSPHDTVMVKFRRIVENHDDDELHQLENYLDFLLSRHPSAPEGNNK